MEWMEEDSIPDHSYNQPQTYEGFNDDRQQRYKGQAYRTLHNWFLADSRQVRASRITLPCNQGKFTLHVCLHGLLEPRINGGSTEKDCIKVVIRRLRYWVMDCSRSTRGIWVFSGNWYKLKQPDKTPVLLPDGRRISQEEVHLRMRAVFGLFSNVADMLMELKAGEGLSFVNYLSSFHKNKTPEQSYEALRPSEEQIEEHPDLHKEPFDMDLLKRESRMIRSNLRDLDQHFLTIQSPFMRGLCRMEKDFHEAEKRAEHWAMGPYNYLHSAEKSEARSLQLPWGDPLPNTPTTLPSPNRLLELDVPTSYDSVFSENWAREHGSAPREESYSNGKCNLKKAAPKISQRPVCKLPGLVTSLVSPTKEIVPPTSSSSVAKKVRFKSPLSSSEPSISKNFCSDSLSYSDVCAAPPDNDSSSQSAASGAEQSSGTNIGSFSTESFASDSQWPINEEAQDLGEVAFGLPGIRIPTPPVNDPPRQDCIKHPKRKRKQQAQKSASPKPERGKAPNARKAYVSGVEAREALRVLEDYILQGDGASSNRAVNRALVFIGEELFMVRPPPERSLARGPTTEGECDTSEPSEGKQYVNSFEAGFAIEVLSNYASANDGNDRFREEIAVLRENLFPL